MRLIDKETLLNKAKDCHLTKAVISSIEKQEEILCECNIERNAYTICNILQADADGEAPDMVEVVRCKDCEMSEEKSAGRLRCKFWRNGVMKDWYCFEGKKRRNEDAAD